MKLKIYLRGLGIGIAVTALILGISYSNKKEMSDAEIIARAKELGMVEAESESGKLSEAFGAETIETEENNTEILETVESVSETQQESETETAEEESDTQIQQSEEAVSPEEADISDTGNEVTAPQETIKVTIVSGDDSAAASRRIYEAGLVESAAEFDKYLCSNGYSKKVVSGTYEIALGSDNETIAKIITKNR